MANIPKTLVLVCWARIEWARDVGGPYFCISWDKNLDNDIDKKFWQPTYNKSIDNLQQTCPQQVDTSHVSAS